MEGERRDAAVVVAAAAANNNGGDVRRRCTGNNWRSHCFVCLGVSPKVALYPYAAVYLVGSVLAWAVRDNHVSYFDRQRAIGCQGHRDCLTAEAVLVISLALFIFFSVMFCTTVATNKVQERRNAWQCGWWPAKLGLLVVSAFIATMAPSYIIKLYGEFAHLGAGLFLLIQLISMIRCLTKLNYRWCQTNFQNSYPYVIWVSVGAYAASIAWTIVMVFWYTGCWQNTVFIVSTVLLAFIMFIMSLTSKAQGFYMEPGLIAVYIVYLCWSAIRSEPETGCYQKHKAGAIWKTILGFFLGLIVMAGSAFSTGTDYKCIQFGSVVESEDDVPYGYGFFHFVFATGSMYFGMLFLGWEMQHKTERWNMDSGWMSTWVHIANEGAVVISFVAIQLDRIYGLAWLRQKLSWIFGTGEQLQQGQGIELPDPEHQRPPRSDEVPDVPASSPVSSAETEVYLSD